MTAPAARPGAASPPRAAPAPPPARRARARNHRVVRVTHWFAAVVMTGSGLQIFKAYPAFHAKGAPLLRVRQGA